KKKLILCTHSYFLAEAQQGLNPSKRGVQQRVHKCLGNRMATVARVVVAENKCKRGTPTVLLSHLLV
ncbi:hypothetical protein PHYSODRAFT_507186, partial [Phytophthora sojae]